MKKAKGNSATIPLPTHLYKYHQFSATALSNLVGRKIWFSRPSSFNDPYDCRIAPKTEISDESIERFLKAKFGDQRGAELASKHRGTDGKFDKDTLEQLQQRLSEDFEKLRHEMSNNRGVCCLSAKKDDLLMWSHYADSHKGFCLEFCTSDERFARAQKVEYSKVIPTVDPVAAVLGEGHSARTAMIFTKMKCWEYEEEWRIFHKKPSTAYGYGVNALTGIYFGSEMERAHIEIIALILKNSPTKLYRMHRSESEFQVYPEEVQYTAYDYGS